MRRKDRELMPEEAWEIVDRCADGVVSMVDDAGAPYAVPVNLVREDNRVYFHSAMAGKKADCMRKHPNVCVACVESGAEIDQPGLTTRYASAILTGTAAEIPGDLRHIGTAAAEVTDAAEKVNALRLLCRKLAPENPCWQGDFHDCIGHTAVWRITVAEITGKANRGKPE